MTSPAGWWRHSIRTASSMRHGPPPAKASPTSTRSQPRRASCSTTPWPRAMNPELRDRLLELRRQQEQLIDATSADELVEANYSKDATARARETVESFERFIRE